jgi:hypothetical protein
MHDRRLCLIGVVVAVGALAACASNPRAASDRRHMQAASLPGKPGCFWLRSVYDWTVLNNQELIVHAPLQKDAYLVKLFQPVFDLRFHQNLGFQDVERTGQICDDSYDYLIVRGYTPPRIPIIAVHQLTMPEQAALLQASGKNVASGQPNHH